MSVRFTLLTLSMLALAAPAFAAGNEAPAAGEAQAKEGNIVVQGQPDPKGRKVCKNEVSTGSVMPKRVCRIVGDSQAASLQAEREMERFRERQLSGDLTTGQR